MIWWIYADILPPVAYALGYFRWQEIKRQRQAVAWLRRALNPPPARETCTLLPHEVDEARRLLKQVRH